MRIRYIAVVVALALVVSCKKDSVTETQADTIVTADTLNAHAQKDSSKKEDPESLLARFAALKEDTKQKIPSLSKEQANSLYTAYYAKNVEIINEINAAETNFLESYLEYAPDENKHVTVPEPIRKKLNQLTKSGLELWYIGEGYFEIRTPAYFYYNIFKDIVTPDYRDYIELRAIDDSKLWVNDAGITISWKELGDKVLTWENFVKKYPESPLAIEARDTYSLYQYWYLFGMDNTPVTENAEGSELYNKIYPEIKEEFQKFISNNPGSPTSKRVQRIIDNEGKDFEKLRKDILKELKIN